MRPNNIKYSDSHEWVRVEGDVAVIGITDFAVEQLSDLVYIELPEVGREVAQGDPFGEIESVKAVSDLVTPVSGEITEVNENLSANLELLQESPFQDGWITKVKMREPGELDKLMSLEEYEKQLETEEE